MTFGDTGDVGPGDAFGKEIQAKILALLESDSNKVQSLHEILFELDKAAVAPSAVLQAMLVPRSRGYGKGTQTVVASTS